jgi:hypothetical protein
MKKITLTIFVMMLFNSIIYSQQTSEKTFVKSFKTEIYEGDIFLDLSPNVEIYKWDRDIFRIFATVKTNQAIEITEKLGQIGRYSVVIEEDKSNHKIIISMPKTSIEVKLRGSYIQEYITIQLNIPYGFTVINNTDFILN